MGSEAEYPRQQTFALSLRVWHDTIDAHEMAANLPFPSPRVCRAGEQRTTPSGRLLDGTYKENFFTASVIDRAEFDIEGFDHNLAACVQLALKRVEPFAEYLRQLKAAGARMEFFIGWIIRSNGGAEISPRLMERLANLGIALSLDIYGKSTRAEE